MGELLKKSLSPFRDTTSVISIVSATGLMAAALLLGIADNPPGVILLFASLLALILVMIHHWRSPRRFLIMAIVALVGIPVMVVLHNLLEAMADRIPYWLAPLASGISATAFLLAVMVLPVTFFAGIIGAGLSKFIRRN